MKLGPLEQAETFSLLSAVMSDTGAYAFIMLEKIHSIRIVSLLLRHTARPPGPPPQGPAQSFQSLGPFKFSCFRELTRLALSAYASCNRRYIAPVLYHGPSHPMS